MFGLLYKEVIVHKKQLIMISPVIIFFTGWCIVPSITTPDLNEWELILVLTLCSIMTILTLAMLEMGIFEADEIKKWQAYIASTPDGIKNQIASKYVFNAALSCSVVSLLTIVYQAAGAINGTDATIGIIILMQLLWIQLLIRALETPFIICFGSKQGNLIRMIIMGAAIFAFIVYGLFGDLSVFGSLKDFLEWMVDFLTKSNNYILMLTPAVTWVLYYISYRISCILYLKGGEHYDK